VNLNGDQAKAMIAAWNYLCKRVKPSQQDLANYRVVIDSNRLHWQVHFWPAKVPRMSFGSPETKVAVARLISIDKRDFSKLEELIEQ
jgi:hypothetical protein